MKAPMSERVKIILANEEDSWKLADAVRRLRKGGDGTFTLSEETINNLKSQEDNT
jgi:hypothetical protein